MRRPRQTLQSTSDKSKGDSASELEALRKSHEEEISKHLATHNEEKQALSTRADGQAEELDQLRSEITQLKSNHEEELQEEV